MSAKAIRRGIYTHLLAELQSLVSGRVYHKKAPQSATYPLVTFQRTAGTDTYTFGERAFENHVWLVKAVDKSASADTADDIAEAIDDALTDAELAISGHEALYLRRATTVEFEEVDGDVTYQHSGATFRLVVA